MSTPANHKNLDQKIEEISTLEQDKCLELLNDIFFNSNKPKALQHQFLNKEVKDGKETTQKTPEDNLQNRYKELSAIAATVIKRLDELDKKAKIDSIKDILGDLSQEEILKALGIDVPVLKARGAKAGATKEPATKVKIWYMNEHNQPDQVEIGLKGPAPSDNPSLKAFLAYAKDTKSKARKDLDVNVMSIEEFRETFQGYKYTAA
ncbi:hypothetical protein U1499_13850 [Aeromonas caviae]|uniref:hypothetical protein n=1 Tax=Aeromonas caviae TaxID=648 RepID=UPI0030157B9A